MITVRRFSSQSTLHAFVCLFAMNRQWTVNGMRCHINRNRFSLGHQESICSIFIDVIKVNYAVYTCLPIWFCITIENKIPRQTHYDGICHLFIALVLRNMSLIYMHPCVYR